VSLAALGRTSKASLICGLLCQSPPGDFGQVVRDLSALVRDDKLVRQEAACVGVCHNKNNFTPVQINGRTVLLTHYNDLGGNSFFDSQDKFSVEFDHLCGVTIKPRLHSVMLDGLKGCVSCHFPVGNSCMFKKSLGKSLWISDWICALTAFTTQGTGIFLLQIHYFRDATLHVAVSEPVRETLNVIDQSQFARYFVKSMKAEDTKFHIAISSEHQYLQYRSTSMLSVTHYLIWWSKLKKKKKKIKIKWGCLVDLFLNYSGEHRNCH
uniref:F-actin-capping protein subunit alpha n=1 Tax=Otus sunia TaxID=257818 RepID=A0A8C8A9K8_9STRI